MSGDVIGGEEEKLFRVSNCTGPEATGSGIRTTLDLSSSTSGVGYKTPRHSTFVPPII